MILLYPFLLYPNDLKNRDLDCAKAPGLIDQSRELSRQPKSDSSGHLGIKGESGQTVYNSLDPLSLAETLAFYELYPNSGMGENARKRACALLNLPLEEEVSSLCHLINPIKNGEERFKPSDILLIEKLAAHLPHRKLKGYQAKTESEIVLLPSEEIDLGRALILSQLNGSENALFKTESYCALLDLMALQILARLPKEATEMEKICEMNRFIFDQMHFRFPPQSVYAGNIDLYTFLPSVMDNHLGVCLGVTALYLALAQRIALPLEIVTPPGHIYVRCRTGEKVVNIETTARGVHLPDETYLSLENSELQLRTLKEVIGMTHINQASIYLYKAEYEKAVAAYEKALPYMPDDPLLKELLGYSYLLTQRTSEGESLLKEIVPGMHAMAEDLLAKKVSLDGIEAVFMLVDETRESLLTKQKRLTQVLEKCPEFRDGLQQLAVTWIQLNRSREAIDALLKLYQLDSEDATTAYYLSALYMERHDYKNSWFYLKKAEELMKKENFSPTVLQQLRRELTALSPESLP